MASNKRIVVRNANSNITLQLNVATTLSFFVYERNLSTTISSIEVQVTKQAGRVPTVLTAWFPVSLLGITNSLYTFEYTVTGVATSDNITLTFRVIDIDGVESFVTVNSINIID